MVFAVLMPWLLFAGQRRASFGPSDGNLNLPPATTGALAVVGGLGNTSFIGLPMIESFYGASGMPTGILIDQLGTYLDAQHGWDRPDFRLCRKGAVTQGLHRQAHLDLSAADRPRPRRGADPRELSAIADERSLSPRRNSRSSWRWFPSECSSASANSPAISACSRWG